MNDTVLDAGALIALERGDRAVWTEIKRSALRGVDVVVPSTALAQVWRGRPSQAMLAKALQDCFVAPFDDVARAVGELCGRTRTRDICDARVAIVASTRGRVLFTSDRGDLRRLLTALGGQQPVIIDC